MPYISTYGTSVFKDVGGAWRTVEWALPALLFIYTFWLRYLSLKKVVAKN
jgi:hypothetical protein